jgi:hypothetical protein
MAEFKFDIQFDIIDLDQYLTSSKKLSQLFKCKLFTDEEVIRLEVYYRIEENLLEKLFAWIRNNGWDSLPKTIICKNENKNYFLKKLSFQDSEIISINGRQKLDKSEGVIELCFDSLVYIWNPNGEKVNSGKFYLNELGFDLVKKYYSPFFPGDNAFKINRFEGTGDFYKYKNLKIRPEFDFGLKDNRDLAETIITKNPMFYIEFDSQDDINEIIDDLDFVLKLSSFYFHQNIEFRYINIYLKDYTISRKKISKHNKIQIEPGFMLANCFISYEEYLTKALGKDLNAKAERLTKAIELIHQSLLVIGRSNFLLRFNAMELFNNEKAENMKFSYVCEDDKLGESFDKALAILLQNVCESDKDEYKMRFNQLKNNMRFKSMKNAIKTFIEKQNVTLSDLGVEINKIISLRNSITHGSNDIDLKIMEEANIELLKLNYIIILNQLGIHDWKYHQV